MDGLNRNSPPFPAQYEAKTKPSAKYTLCDCFVTVLSLLIYIADVITGKHLGFSIASKLSVSKFLFTMFQF